MVLLRGARQVGKTALLRNAPPFNGWSYHTLEDEATLEVARRDPAALWADADAVVLDDVQRAPEVVAAVGQAVARAPERRFVLATSANTARLQEELAALGERAIVLVLGPLTLGEAEDAPAPSFLVDALAGRWPEADPSANGTHNHVDPFPVILRGLKPALLGLADAPGWRRWWEDYVSEFLALDLHHLSQIDALPDFRRLMTVLVQHTGQVLNQSDMAREAGLSQPTAHRYIHALEAGHILRRVPAYTNGSSQALVKAPRVFWTDVALAVHLAGYTDAGVLAGSRDAGGFFEALVVQHLRALADLLVPRPRLRHWRPRAGAAVDLIVQHQERRVAIEVEAGDGAGDRSAVGLRRYLGQHPEAVGAAVVHGGGGVKRLDERIVAVPWEMLTGVRKNPAGVVRS